MPHRLTSLDYHRGTRHPGGELMDDRHGYHPGMRPTLYKRFRGLPSIELNIGQPADGPPALSAIGANDGYGAQPDRMETNGGAQTVDPLDPPAVSAATELTLDRLTRVLHYSAGITKRLRGYPFRAAACTGALYHIELYIVNADLDGLQAGVYHYDPEGSRLLRLREGDYRAALSENYGGNGIVRRAPLTLVYADVFWRNAIKYQARAYRHSFWDSGVIAANTISMAAALELPAKLVMGFADGGVARLLGLDSAEELPLALLALGSGTPAAPRRAAEPEPIEPEWEPRTEGSRFFPVIPRIHQATALEDGDQARAWRQRAVEWAAGSRAAVRDGETRSERRAGRGQAGTEAGLEETHSGGGGPELRLEPRPQSELPTESLERVIVRRGSSRAFAREPIDGGQLAALLDRSLRPIPVDYPRPAPIVRPYLIANAVQGLEPGVYQVQAEQAGTRLRQIRAGEFRRQAAELALGQALGGDAAANLYFLSPLEQVLAQYGERGYRLAQMEAAVTAGWGYLAAYALGLGATGLTFYDDLVEHFLGVSDQGLKVMFLLAVGAPRRG